MKLVWDQSGDKMYEVGVSKAILFPISAGAYPMGYAWSGLISAALSPSGAEASPVYADNQKYLNLISIEEMAGSLEAYMYPVEFKQCDGSAALTDGVYVGQQSRKMFGLAFQTVVGNDQDLNDHAYKWHILYGCLAAPTEKSYSSIADSTDPTTFSWDISTTPVEVTGAKPTSYVEIDSRTADADLLAAFEGILMGTEAAEPRLPLPDEIKTLMTPA